MRSFCWGTFGIGNVVCINSPNEYALKLLSQCKNVCMCVCVNVCVWVCVSVCVWVCVCVCACVCVCFRSFCINAKMWWVCVCICMCEWGCVCVCVCMCVCVSEASSSMQKHGQITEVWTWIRKNGEWERCGIEESVSVGKGMYVCVCVCVFI
jgi:hypothetical protein